jgi:hypothetical protein
MIEQQIRDLFAETAGREPPAPAQVDLQAARRRGRAMLRWRRAGLTGASVLVAALVATLVVVVPAGPAPRPAVTGPAAPLHFSPLVTNLSFGWLPPGMSVQQGGVLPTEAFADTGSSAHPVFGWGVYVFSRGRCHVTRSARLLACPPDPPGGTNSVVLSGPAPSVAGHRAFWSTRELVWEYAPGGWAQLMGPVAEGQTLRHDPALRTTAFRIAANLHVGPDTPHLKFAERFPGLKGQSRFTDLHYFADRGTLQATQFILLNEGSRFLRHVGDSGVWTNAAYVIGERAPHNGTCSPGDPNTQSTRVIINGYHMWVKRGTSGVLAKQEICGAHAGGLWFDIQEFGSHPSIGVTKLFRDHVHLLGRNPASWTQDPLG